VKAKAWTPGCKWLRGFKHRCRAAGHPLQQRKINRRSPLGPTRSQYQKWLEELWLAITTLGVAKAGRTQEEIQSRMINVDETGIDHPTPDKIRVMVPPKSDAAFAIQRENVDHVTLVGAVDAAGGHMPAFLIHKGANELSKAALQRCRMGSQLKRLY
jgi:hypothetical protein